MTLLTSPRPRTPRRGVTLVEMLVAVALLVLMMSVIVQVFMAATSAVSASRSYQELDQGCRQLDATIRTDLAGVTARLTPPLNPQDNLGYFEYGENSPADLQGEDTDDYLRFTVKAPEGQLFTGRMWPNTPPPVAIGNMSAPQIRLYLGNNPITISSQYAEVIYFLRNGNLYRRVLLVAPGLQSAVSQNIPTLGGNSVVPGALGGAALYGGGATVSWLAVNDVSAHPTPVFNPATAFGTGAVILNSLGDLTNRENRMFYQRFASDYANQIAPGNLQTDGIPDDLNGDTVPDYWPSLYAGIFTPSRGSLVPLVNELPTGVRPGLNQDMLAFPYIYPGAYSRPDPGTSALGWIHTPDPGRSQLSLLGLNNLNHNPLDVGDSLPQPLAPQTWWGFPTWRETIHRAWTDPVAPVSPFTNGPGTQPNPLHWLDPSISPPTFAGNAATDLLPPMTNTNITGTTTLVRLVPQPFNDGAGSPLYAVTNAPFPTLDFLWKQTWEDDLIMTGVRSFDVKAYDNAFGGYVDLGWGNDLRQYVGYTANATLAGAAPAFLGLGNTVVPLVFLWPPALGSTNWPPNPVSEYVIGYNAPYDLINQTYAHEGRIPPLTLDHRPDSQFPLLNNNLGDDNANVVRLRRVWDTWSTDYSNAPATGINPVTGQPTGPPFGPPIYPSYPPPYPMPLRGIQIQIRVVDPRNEHVKVLTIRQDFSDKL